MLLILQVWRYWNHLVIALLSHEVFLLEDHPQPGEEHDEAMASVTKHDREQERERDDGKGSCGNKNRTLFQYNDKYDSISNDNNNNHDYDYNDNSYLTYRGLNKMAAIMQTTFPNVFSWMKINTYWLRFHWCLLLYVLVTINQHVKSKLKSFNCHTINTYTSKSRKWKFSWGSALVLNRFIQCKICIKIQIFSSKACISRFHQPWLLSANERRHYICNISFHRLRPFRAVNRKLTQVCVNISSYLGWPLCRLRLRKRQRCSGMRPWTCWSWRTSVASL